MCSVIVSFGTATTMNNINQPITTYNGSVATPFHLGSGHVEPVHASDPGLIYDATYDDYLIFLCGRGFKNIDANFKCPNTTILPWNLNYPSVAVDRLNGTVTVERTVTNVGFPVSIYRAYVESPAGFSVKVTPEILEFNELGEKKKFELTIKSEGVKMKKGEYKFGWFAWYNDFHFVKSPIAVSTAN